jgi:hypothetical protein
LQPSRRNPQLVPRNFRIDIERPAFNPAGH